MNQFFSATARNGLGLVTAALMGFLALGPQLPPTGHDRSALVPVVISAANAAGARAAAQSLIRAGGTVSRNLVLINGFAGLAPSWALEPLAALNEIRSVTPNASMHPLGATYSPTTDVGSLYNTAGITGARAMWA